MQFRKGLVVIALLIFSMTSRAGLALAQENLLSNGSFELPAVTAGGITYVSNGQNTIPGWSVVGAAGNVGVISGTFTQSGYSFPAQDGTQWLDLTGYTNTATGVQQTVSTTAGITYNLSFWVGNVVGNIFGTTSTVNVLVNGQQILAAINTGGTTTLNWQQFTTSFMATGSTTTIEFLNGDPFPDNNCSLDNVVLIEAPRTTKLFASFPGYGLYSWDGTAWTGLTIDNAQNMVVSGSTLYADFGAIGLWKWNGSSWSKLAPENPENMVVSGSTLYVDFGAIGLWMWDGSSWSQLTSVNPENMVASGSTLYVDFGATGLWMWDGSKWIGLTGDNPSILIAN